LHESKATVGCLLKSGRKYFAWTAAHAFFDLSDFSEDGTSNSFGGDIEFSLIKNMGINQLMEDLT